MAAMGHGKVEMSESVPAGTEGVRLWSGRESRVMIRKL